VVIGIGGNPAVAVMRDGTWCAVEYEERVQHRLEGFGFPSVALGRALATAGCLPSEVEHLLLFDTFWPVACLSDVGTVVPSGRDELLAVRPPNTSMDVERLAASLGMQPRRVLLVSRAEALAEAIVLSGGERRERALIFDSELGRGDLAVVRCTAEGSNLERALSTGLGPLLEFLGRRCGLPAGFLRHYDLGRFMGSVPTDDNPFCRHLVLDRTALTLTPRDARASLTEVGLDEPVLLPSGLLADLEGRSPEEVLGWGLPFVVATFGTVVELLGLQATSVAYTGNLGSSWLLPEAQYHPAACRKYAVFGTMRASDGSLGAMLGGSLPRDYTELLHEQFPEATIVEDPVAKVCALLRAGKVVGVLRGRAATTMAELGQRSILALPEQQARLTALFSATAQGFFLDRDPERRTLLGPFIDHLDRLPQEVEAPWTARDLRTIDVPWYKAVLAGVPEQTVLHLNLSRNFELASSYLSDALEVAELGILDALLVENVLVEFPEHPLEEVLELIRAINLFNRDHEEEARRAFEQILAVRPSSALAQYYLGSLYFLRKNNFESLGHLSEAMVCQQLLALPYMSAVNLLITIGYHKEALNVALRFSRYCRERFEAHFQQAIAAKNLGQFQDAYRLLERLDRDVPFEKKYAGLLRDWRPTARRLYLGPGLPTLLQCQVAGESGVLDLKLFHEVLDQFPEDHGLKVVLAGHGAALGTVDLDLYVNDVKACKGHRICEVVLDLGLDEPEGSLDRLMYSDLDRLSLIVPEPTPEWLERLSRFGERLEPGRELKLDLYFATCEDDELGFLEAHRLLAGSYSSVLSNSSLKAGVAVAAREPAQAHSGTPCLCPFYSLTLATDGRYLPCWPALRAQALPAFGSVTSTTLLEFWSGATMQEVRRQQLALSTTPLQCCAGCALADKFPRRVIEEGDVPHGVPSLERLTQLITWYHGKGLTQAALGALRLMTTLDPDNAACHFDLGELYATLSDHEAAAASYERGLALQPGMVDVVFRLSETYMQLGKMGKAKKLLLRLKNELQHT